MAKQQYYDIEKTIKNYPDCKYIVVYGERSNGKSYSALKYCIKKFYQSGGTSSFGYIRRWTDDIKSSNMEQVFKSLRNNEKGDNAIAEVTKGEYNDVEYKTRCFYLVHKNEDGEIDKKCDEPVGYIFSLSESERIKSTGYPSIKSIIFEEFISEGLPMVNEFNRYMSVLSTIIRNRDDVIIMMLGNTVNKYNIYFAEFGFYKAKNQKKNTVDVYEYQCEDGSILKIACEYADMPDRKIKKSNIYFAFNNKNAMITNGSWQIGSYPHLPYYYKPKDIKLMYFIKFDNEIFQCEIIKVIDNKDNKIIIPDGYKFSNRNVCFTYIHRKTTEIKTINDNIIYQQIVDSKPNIRRKINNCYDDISRFIYSFFTTEKVFYQDNEVGNAIESYINWCMSN